MSIEQEENQRSFINLSGSWLKNSHRKSDKWRKVVRYRRNQGSLSSQGDMANGRRTTGNQKGLPGSHDSSF